MIIYVSFHFKKKRKFLEKKDFANCRKFFYKTYLFLHLQLNQILDIILDVDFSNFMDI